MFFDPFVVTVHLLVDCFADLQSIAGRHSMLFLNYECTCNQNTCTCLPPSDPPRPRTSFKFALPTAKQIAVSPVVHIYINRINSEFFQLCIKASRVVSRRPKRRRFGLDYRFDESGVSHCDIGETSHISISQHKIEFIKLTWWIVHEMILP